MSVYIPVFTISQLNKLGKTRFIQRKPWHIVNAPKQSSRDNYHLEKLIRQWIESIRNYVLSRDGNIAETTLNTLLTGRLHGHVLIERKYVTQPDPLHEPIKERDQLDRSTPRNYYIEDMTDLEVTQDQLNFDNVDATEASWRKPYSNFIRCFQLAKEINETLSIKILSVSGPATSFMEQGFSTLNYHVPHECLGLTGDTFFQSTSFMAECYLVKASKWCAVRFEHETDCAISFTLECPSTLFFLGQKVMLEEIISQHYYCSAISPSPLYLSETWATEGPFLVTSRKVQSPEASMYLTSLLALSAKESQNTNTLQKIIYFKEPKGQGSSRLLELSTLNANFNFDLSFQNPDLTFLDNDVYWKCLSVYNESKDDLGVPSQTFYDVCLNMTNDQMDSVLPYYVKVAKEHGSDALWKNVQDSINSGAPYWKAIATLKLSPLWTKFCPEIRSSLATLCRFTSDSKEEHDDASHPCFVSAMVRRLKDEDDTKGWILIGCLSDEMSRQGPFSEWTVALNASFEYNLDRVMKGLRTPEDFLIACVFNSELSTTSSSFTKMTLMCLVENIVSGTANDLLND